MVSKILSICLLMVAVSFAESHAQRGAPIVLEQADSLVGIGASDVGRREFVGNVRFTQGNVTVTCDRAIQYLSQNAVDLFGNVVVTQEALQMNAPRASYDGRTNIAKAFDGIRIVDGGRVLTAKYGTYNTDTEFAEFHDSVVAVDDTLTLWSQYATYEKRTKVSTASGNVVARDSARGAILRGDSVYHDPRIDYMRLIGTAAVWQQDSSDTIYVIADTIDTRHQPSEVFIAQGAVEFVSGSVAAVADSLHHDVEAGTYDLFRSPILWADSTQLHGDTIHLDAPDQELDQIVGRGKAILISKSDTLRPDRYDQVTGDVVTIKVVNDSIRDLRAVGSAQSITWRVEEEEGEGLAKFAADTIIAAFDGGELVDIYWLTGVVGEHHPEPVVAGHETTYKLSTFAWDAQRPIMPPPSKPWEPPTIHRREVVSTGENVDSSTSKKK